MKVKNNFSIFILNRIKVPYFLNGVFLNIFLSVLFGDYILFTLQKSHISVNGNVFLIFYKKKIFYYDFIEFRFFLCLKKVILEFHFFSIIYEDIDFFMVNKKANLITSGKSSTLLNSLLYIYPQLIYIPRQGIVHRLDKCTTGLLIVAKTKFSFFRLSKFFLFQKITRIYNILILGMLMSSGFIKIPLNFYSSNIFTNFFNFQSYKYSISFYRIVKHFYKFTLIKVYLGSGRKNQIRAHFSTIGYPIIGDFLYSNFYNYQMFTKIPICFTFLQARQLIFYHFFFLRFFSFSLRLNWKLNK